MSYPNALAALSKSCPVYDVWVFCTDPRCSCEKHDQADQGPVGCCDTETEFDLTKPRAYRLFRKMGWTHTDEHGWKCPCCPFTTDEKDNEPS